MSERERIVTALREALARNRPALEAIARATSHEPPPFVHEPQPDVVGHFVSEVERLHARAHRCAGDAAAYDMIGRIVKEHQARTILAWDEQFIGLPGFDGWLKTQGVARADARLKPCATEAMAQDAAAAVVQDFSPVDRRARLQGLEPVPLGITGADVAIAESGTVILLGGAGRPRLASLLPPAHIAVVRPHQLVRGLGEALARLKERYGAAMFDDASNLTFITGPSRTADIELTLTLGVHGPREVHIVIIT